MNIKLREVSAEQPIGVAHRAGPPSRRRRGIPAIIDRTTQRRAVRQVNMLAEQETERLWFWRMVRVEVERARRRDVDFTVLCIRDLDAEVLVELAHQIRPQLRDMDAVVTERGRVLILLGETSSAQALHVTRRLAGNLTVLHDEAQWQEVSFPRDALTLGALIECLLGNDTGRRLMLAG